MSSKNKWNKLKHSNAWGGALKEKDSKLKKFLFFTSAQRCKNKKDCEDELARAME